jgi:hypothetical protein
MKRLLFIFVVLIGLVSCSESTNKTETKKITFSTGYIYKIALTDGKFQDFVIHYKDVKTQKMGKFRTQEILWNVGDTVDVLLEEKFNPHGSTKRPIKLR